MRWERRFGSAQQRLKHEAVHYESAPHELQLMMFGAGDPKNSYCQT